LLPGCAAIIHQGGAGTTMTAMSNGTPQLVMPSAVDAIVNAQQVERTGAGRHLWPVDLDDTTLQQALDAFLGNLPTHQQAATRLRQQHLTQPTPAEVTAQLARDIEQFTGPWATTVRTRA
ncbi:glycosyltransferase, partial [Kitasatospora sp. NPDC001175]|uniref:glycosyltransferase n=1 Tax=Kitasatospora sp. NPDC001175 TaxID=3157103 RepID=UPI003D070B2D